MLDAYPPAILAAIVAVFLLGGVVKGCVGFALPMVALAGVGSFLPAQQAVALLIVPTLVTNVWQTMRQGLAEAGATARDYWRLNLAMGVMIALVAQAVPAIPSSVLFVFLGVMVGTAAVTQLLGWVPPRPESARAIARAEWGTGAVAGVFGGMSGVWGPPVLLYLLARATPKTRLVRAQGIAFLIGSVILTAAHVKSGLLNAATFPLSVALVLPTALGMAVGLRLQDRMNPVAFKRVTLIVLCLAGANLLRRGVFG